MTSTTLPDLIFSNRSGCGTRSTISGAGTFLKLCAHVREKPFHYLSIAFEAILVSHLPGNGRRSWLVQHPGTTDRIQRCAFIVFGQINAALEQFHDETLMRRWCWLRRRCWRYFFLQSLRWTTTIRCRRFDIIFVFGHIDNILQSTFQASTSCLNYFRCCKFNNKENINIRNSDAIGV